MASGGNIFQRGDPPGSKSNFQKQPVNEISCVRQIETVELQVRMRIRKTTPSAGFEYLRGDLPSKLQVDFQKQLNKISRVRMQTQIQETMLSGRLRGTRIITESIGKDLEAPDTECGYKKVHGVSPVTFIVHWIKCSQAECHRHRFTNVHNQPAKNHPNPYSNSAPPKLKKIMVYNDCDVPLDVVSGYLVSDGSSVANNFAVGDDCGITRSGNAEASDAEDEEEPADAAAPILGRGRRNRVPTRRYEGTVKSVQFTAVARGGPPSLPPSGSMAGIVVDVGNDELNCPLDESAKKHRDYEVATSTGTVTNHLTSGEKAKKQKSVKKRSANFYFELPY
ncbi:hypothetical protein C8R45DRAFT_921615 [Mycena sanguinolenta]|nr:hypothetical protein C8R45DRAFT_921615 [Mycena sanguinolenta]